MCTTLIFSLVWRGAAPKGPALGPKKTVTLKRSGSQTFASGPSLVKKTKGFVFTSSFQLYID